MSYFKDVMPMKKWRKKTATIVADVWERVKNKPYNYRTSNVQFLKINF